MYLRHDTIKKDGKKNIYWRLVRSVRGGRKVHQETVAQLGELKGARIEQAKALAARLGGHEDEKGLFDPPIEKEVAEARLNGVGMERIRQFGSVWIGEKLWRMAKFDEFFEYYLSEGREDIPWWKMAEIAERQVGRLLQRNQRAGSLFQIEFKKNSKRASKLELMRKRDNEHMKWAEQSAGCYILRTPIQNWNEKDIWKMHIQLTQVEDAFRVHKSQLEIRPICHQKKERERAFLFAFWHMSFGKF